MVEHPAFNRKVRGSIPRRGKEILGPEVGGLDATPPACAKRPKSDLQRSKICARCHLPRPVTEFCKLAYRAGSLDCYCCDCRRQYNRLYHQVRAPSHRLAVARNKQQRRGDIREKVEAYLSTHQCVQCGESDLRVLEFDHVHGGKLCNVSQLFANAARWDCIAAEIDKCEVRCANCHRRRTAMQLNWHANLKSKRAWRGSNPQPPDSKSGTLSN